MVEAKERKSNLVEFEWVKGSFLSFNYSSHEFWYHKRGWNSIVLIEVFIELAVPARQESVTSLLQSLSGKRREPQDVSTSLERRSKYPTFLNLDRGWPSVFP
jgi:hypothetical protein